MATLRRSHKTALAVLLGVALVGATIALTVLEPTDIQREQPFVTKITALNQPATTRLFKVAVIDAKLADRLTTDKWLGTTDGVWLVVDFAFATRVKIGKMSGTVTIDGVEYLSSARATDVGLDNAFADPGLAWEQSMIFELPKTVAGAHAHTATVQFAMSDDPRLNGVAEWSVDLSSLDHTSSLAVSDPGRLAG